MNRSRTPLSSRAAKWLVAVIVAVLLVVTSLFLLLGKRLGLEVRPGFLGTFAPFYADVNLIAQIVLLIGLLVGFILIRAHKSGAHQYLKTSLVLFSVVMTVFFMGGKLIMLLASGVSFSPIILVEGFHGLMGTLSILAGLFLILRMNNALPNPMRITWWKNLMRITFGLYLLVGIGGVALYVLLYIPR
jgi:hypothetical protein